MGAEADEGGCITTCLAAGESKYGALLAPYLSDPSNLFVVSSDFCHWGSRFSFTYYDKSQGPIHKSIEALDKQGRGERGVCLADVSRAPTSVLAVGMEWIAKKDPVEFGRYLKAFGNTICGRHPIQARPTVDKEPVLESCAGEASHPAGAAVGHAAFGGGVLGRLAQVCAEQPGDNKKGELGQLCSSRHHASMKPNSGPNAQSPPRAVYLQS